MAGSRFDPWDLVALPLWWMILAGYTARDFICDRLRSKPL